MTQVCQKKIFGLRQINSKSQPVPSVRRGQDLRVTPGMLGSIERGVGLEQHAGDVLGDGADACTDHQDSVGAPAGHGMDAAQAQDDQALREQQQAGHQLAGFLGTDQ